MVVCFVSMLKVVLSFFFLKKESEKQASIKINIST